MKIAQIYCPSCGGSIKGDLTKDSVICPFCGTQLAIDHEKKEITINQNINKNISISKNQTKRIIDEAEIIRAKTENTKAKSNAISEIAAIIALLIIILLSFLMSIIA